MFEVYPLEEETYSLMVMIETLGCVSKPRNVHKSYLNASLWVDIVGANETQVNANDGKTRRRVRGLSTDIFDNQSF